MGNWGPERNKPVGRGGEPIYSKNGNHKSERDNHQNPHEAGRIGLFFWKGSKVKLGEPNRKEDKGAGGGKIP